MSRVIWPRSSWRPAHEPGPVLKLPLRDAWLHHTDTTMPADASLNDEAAHMRLLERIGFERFGTTISYSVVVFPSGRAWEGCGVGRRGSHTKDRNSSSVGIVYVGNGNASATPAALATLAAVLLELHEVGVLERARFTGGHRDVVKTACPGDGLYAQLPTINARAVLTPAPAPRPPSPHTTPDRPTGGLTVRTLDLRAANTAPVRGAGVRPLQRLLRVTADGVAGKDTRAALVAAQRRLRLEQDAIAGPATYSALLAES